MGTQQRNLATVDIRGRYVFWKLPSSILCDRQLVRVQSRETRTPTPDSAFYITPGIQYDPGEMNPQLINLVFNANQFGFC